MPHKKRSFPRITLSLFVLCFLLAILLSLSAYQLLALRQRASALAPAVVVAQEHEAERYVQRDHDEPTPLFERLTFVTKSGQQGQCAEVRDLLADTDLVRDVALSDTAFDTRIQQFFDEYIPSTDRPVFEDAYAEMMATPEVGLAYICAADDKVAFLFGSSLARVTPFVWRAGQAWVLPSIDTPTTPYYVPEIDTGFELLLTGQPFSQTPAWDAWRIANTGEEIAHYTLDRIESCTATDAVPTSYLCSLEHVFAHE